MRALLLLAALSLGLACALGLPCARAGEHVNVRWQGKTGTSAALPPGFPEPAHAVLTAWEPFLKRAGYRADADATGRTLLFTSEKSTHTDDQLHQLAKVSAWFDAHLPAPAAAPKSAPVCAALFVVRDPEENAQLLAQLAQIAPALAGWTVDAKKDTGFVLSEPLCAAFLESAPALKEWSPAHELVDRATQLLLVQRHGEQPYWIQQGLAWAAEWAYDGTLFSFPYRNEFIKVTEHAAWPGDLKTLVAARAPKLLELSEFALMRRGHWDPERARLAFGCASFLALQPGPKLGEALTQLAAFRDENNRKDKGDGTWTRDPLYEIPADKQLEILEAQLGPKLMERATAFLAKGADGFRALARP
jgi:hypothetical protein